MLEQIESGDISSIPIESEHSTPSEQAQDSLNSNQSDDSFEKLEHNQQDETEHIDVASSATQNFFEAKPVSVEEAHRIQMLMVVLIILLIVRRGS